MTTPARRTRTRTAPSTGTLGRGHPAQVLRTIHALVSAYVGICVLTMVAIVALRHHDSMVNDAVWTRGVIVLASSLLTLRFAVAAGRGAGRSLLRLRIISIIMPIAIVVIIVLPGTFPVWLKIDQAVCGVLLVVVAVLAGRKSLRGAGVTRSRS